ncbi:MAG: GH25 family lysozyme [Oscillospiraceae bacterium]
MKKLISRSIAFFTAILISVSAASINIFAEEEDNYPEDTMMDEITDDDPSDIDDNESTDSSAASDNSDINEDQEGVIGNNERTKVTRPANRIRIISETKPTLDLGSTYQIKYKLYPAQSDDYVTYKSINPSVAMVDDDGLVSVVGVGTAVIKVKTSKGLMASVKITVTDPYTYGNNNKKVTKIVPVSDNITLRQGETSSLGYILYPLGAYDTVSFRSEDPSIASVDQNGVIKGISDGITDIILKTSSGKKAVCSVSVYSDFYKGIDVSKWQGDIDWKKVSKSGIDFAMIRSSFGSTDVDIKLKRNVKGCEKYGIPYGFYHYTYARTVSEAKKEARFFLKTIKNYSPEYPVVLDIEESFYNSMSRKEVTNIITAFMEELENAGYFAMIYSGAKFLTDNTYIEKLTAYDIWVACWGDEERLMSNYDYHYGMWQYSSTGRVKGIDGDVDLNYAFKNYPQRIRSNGLNNL